MNILFVCTGNTCRSAMAEAMLKKMLVEKNLPNLQVKSCGVGASAQFLVPEIVKKLMLEENIDISKHKAQALAQEAVEDTDLILVMENRHREEIIKKFPQAKDKIFLLKEYVEKGQIQEEAKSPAPLQRYGVNSEQRAKDLGIYDPIGQSPEVYRFCKEEIKKCLIKLITQITEGRLHR